MKVLTVCLIAQADSTHAINWSNALNDVGVKVVLLSPSAAKVSPSLSPDVTVLSLEIPGTDFYYKPPLRKVFSLWMRLRRILREIRADIVHLHYMPASYANLFLWRGMDNLVVSVWGSDIVSKQDDTRTRRGRYKSTLLRQARAISATTQYLADETRRYVDAGRPIAVIPFGVDLRKFTPAGTRDKQRTTIRVGFCKHLEPTYDPLTLIRAFAIALREVPSLELILCGRGSLESDARKLCETLGIGGRVEFTGLVPHSDVPEMLRSFDIFVMPSIAESFGLAAVEAQACGVPVVASDLPGIREAVLADETGLLVPAGNVEAFSRAIMSLAKDPSLRAKIGGRGVQHVRDTFDIRRGAQAFAELYRTAMT